MPPLVFRLKGSTFLTTARVYAARPGPHRSADDIARDVVTYACQRLGGVAPSPTGADTVTLPDPAAAFTAPLVKTDRRAAHPLDHKTPAAGLLPDPRNPNGPTHYTPAPRRPLLDRGLDYIASYAPTMRAREFGPLINDHAAVPDDVESLDWDCSCGPSRGVLTATVWVLAGLAALVAALVAL